MEKSCSASEDPGGSLADFAAEADAHRVKLEALLAGSAGRQLLWRTLAAAAPDEPRIADIDFADLLRRSERDADALREHHAAAVAEMLAAG